jgi:hypothetical protein
MLAAVTAGLRDRTPSRAELCCIPATCGNCPQFCLNDLLNPSKCLCLSDLRKLLRGGDRWARRSRPLFGRDRVKLGSESYVTQFATF